MSNNSTKNYVNLFTCTYLWHVYHGLSLSSLSSPWSSETFYSVTARLFVRYKRADWRSRSSTFKKSRVNLKAWQKWHLETSPFPCLTSGVVVWGVSKRPVDVVPSRILLQCPLLFRQHLAVFEGTLGYLLVLVYYIFLRGDCYQLPLGPSQKAFQSWLPRYIYMPIIIYAHMML